MYLLVGIVTLIGGKVDTMIYQGLVGPALSDSISSRR